MLKRIEKILAVAIENRDDAIVLGAFGAGVFHNHPEDVAKYFNKNRLIKSPLPLSISVGGGFISLQREIYYSYKK